MVFCFSENGDQKLPFEHPDKETIELMIETGNKCMQETVKELGRKFEVDRMEFMLEFKEETKSGIRTRIRMNWEEFINEIGTFTVSQ